MLLEYFGVLLCCFYSWYLLLIYERIVVNLLPADKIFWGEGKIYHNFFGGKCNKIVELQLHGVISVEAFFR